MPEISVEVEVYCSCGEGLCDQSTSSSERYRPNITVEPCEKCLARAIDEARSKGYEEARKEFEV